MNTSGTQNYSFNPFGKDLAEIEGKDLNALTTVSEGWYVDYKSKMLGPRDIGKHISAFANQYGGWLFFGIEESDKKCAGKFTGIATVDIPAALDTIRDAVSSHVRPELFYELKTIYGPVQEISLNADSAIIIIYVYEGKNPPYIHSSGRIYKRVADHSEPKPETDPYLVEKLSDKKKKNADIFKEFLSLPSVYKEKYKEQPIAHLYFFTNPDFDKNLEFLSFSQFKTVMSGNVPDLGISIPFNVIHSAPSGYIARQTTGNDPLSPVMEFRWWHDANCRFTMPLSLYNKRGFSEICKKYNHGERFLEEISRHGFNDIKISDFSDVLRAFGAAFNQYKELLTKTNNGEKIKCLLKIQNTFNVSPFIDDRVFLDEITKANIPVIQEDHLEIPSSASSSNLIDMDWDKPKDFDGNKYTNAMISIYVLAAILLNQIGVFNDIEELKVTNGLLKYRSLFFKDGAPLPR